MTTTFFSGRNGTIYADKGTGVFPTTPITAVDYSISLSRNVAGINKVGFLSDIYIPGKLSVTGTLSRVLVTPEYLAWALGTPTGDAAAGSCMLGHPQIFGITGRLSKNGSSMNLSAKNCFFISGELPIGDADEVVKTDLQFAIENPSMDFVLEYPGAAPAPEAEVTQMRTISVTAAANAAADTILGTVAVHGLIIQGIVVHADAAQTSDLTSCPIYGGSGKVVTFISSSAAIQSNLGATNEQVGWDGEVYLPVGTTIVMEHNGTGGTSLDLTVTIRYMATVTGGILT